jgi:putative methionine-R-sulfoxide reductase with GAF domain
MYRTVLLPLRTVLLAIKQQQRLGNEKALLAKAVASGDLDREVSISSVLHLENAHINQDEVGMVLRAVVAMSEAQVTLDKAFAQMTAALRLSRSEDTHRDAMKSALFELNKLIRTEQTTEELAERTLAFIAAFLTAQIGLLYRFDTQSDSLKLLAGYAVSLSGLPRTSIPCGEGLVGQAASERRMICLTDIPADYLTITSAVGSAAPSHVTILPVMHNDELVGIMELGSFSPFTDKNFEFINLALEELAIALKINHSRQLVDELLIHTRQQTELLVSKQEHQRYENPESNI